MNKNFIDTIYLFSCGAKGIDPLVEGNEFDYKEIYKIAKEQGVWETVFLSYIKIYNKHPDIIPEDTFKRLHSEFMMKCGVQYRRYDFIHNLLKKLDDCNIKACVLKGESLARFYDTPIARVSSDVDILIEPHKVDLCLKTMRDLGFEIGDKNYESHQIECTHPIAGLVEIHTMMYGKKTEDVCFNNEVKYNEDYVEVKAEDGTSYKTLGITDNFIFIFLHFIKHFLSFGVGIRQLEDVLIYTEKNYETIDWERVSALFKKLGFEKIFKCVIAIGKKYFSFPENLFDSYIVNDSLVEQVFDDMMQGGVFGHNDTSRQGFYELYLTERYKKIQNKDYAVYKNKRKLTRLFPNRKFMSVNFPYVKKSVLLMPIAWIHRIILGIFKSKSKSKTTIETNQEHQKRLTLMKELGML